MEIEWSFAGDHWLRRGAAPNPAAPDRIEDLDDALPAEVYIREPLPWEAAFLAAKAFVGYRRRGGARRSPLPDFYIGAHAAVRGYRLLTRDPARYAAYFPTVELVAPGKAQ